MAAVEHLLAIVEPTCESDAALGLARSVVERGGQASIVVVMTKRARRDIDAFARHANLGIGDATEIALHHLTRSYEKRSGAGTTVSIAESSILGRNLHRHLASGTTAIAIPARLATRRALRRLTSTTGLPVTVAPRQAA
ncbi:MAG: hypothetical protein KDB37_01960 [Ilumatobacter sp.]|nr:hypothetical protein [Ilumatobacter sp.]